MLEFLEKKETKTAGIIIAVIFLIITIVMLSDRNTIKQTKNSHTHEAGGELVLEAGDFFEADGEVLDQMEIDTSAVNINKTGTYEAAVTYKNKEYTIDVNVVDTTAPKVEFAQRYVFANDASNVDFSGMIESTTDASECTVKLIRFEHMEALGIMDENTLKSLTDAVNTHAKEEELKSLGMEDIPAEEGIYRAVLEAADEQGNTTYEEIVLILDKTGAKIEDVADRTITVSPENVSAEPVVDRSEYTIRDNADGKIEADDIMAELELRNEENHEWLVHVSYVDRAGNESRSTFLITVKADSTADDTGNDGASNQDGGTNNSGNGGISNQGGGTNNSGNGGLSNVGSTNQNNTTGSEAGSDENVSTGEDADDTPTNNLDESTWMPTDDESVISPYMQKLIDAGYGNVVDWGNGQYGVLVHSDYTANGKDGYELIKEYLAERNLEPMGGYAGIIDRDNDWYFCEVLEVRELTTSDWDDEEIEWID